MHPYDNILVLNKSDRDYEVDTNCIANYAANLKPSRLCNKPVTRATVIAKLFMIGIGHVVYFDIILTSIYRY